jgi:hypothetical protein
MSIQHSHRARRLCHLVDQMNVLPGKIFLSAKDIVWLGQNQDVLRRSGTEAGVQEASKLIADLLPEAEQIIKDEEADRRMRLAGYFCSVIVTAWPASFGIYGLAHGQPWGALLIFPVVAILATVLVICPFVQHKREAYWNAQDEELGQSWTLIELLTADC